MTAIHPHSSLSEVVACDVSKVTVYWFDAERRLRRDGGLPSELSSSVGGLFGPDATAQVCPITDDSGEVIGIASRVP